MLIDNKTIQKADGYLAQEILTWKHLEILCCKDGVKYLMTKIEVCFHQSLPL